MSNDGPGSHWRRTARSVIANAIENAPADIKDDIHKLFRHVSKAYPWGERRLHPYKMWCKEVRLARTILERSMGLSTQQPFMVRCTACGAHRGIPCRPIGSIADDLMVAADAELEGRTDVAEKLRNNAFHEARLRAVGIIPPDANLPLFERALNVG